MTTRTLDRIYRPDLRSLNHDARTLLPTDEPVSKTWSLTSTLDQGQDGACVGFGFAQELMAEPVPVHGITDLIAVRDIYWNAQRIDSTPGGEYPGASPVYQGSDVIAGAKVIVKVGGYTAYKWALDLESLVLNVGHNGPAVLGVNWWTNMFDPDPNGFLHPTGKIEGGHCILNRAVHIVWSGKGRTWGSVNLDRSYAVLHNSWGPQWGNHGAAKVSLTDLGSLLNDSGEACLPVRTKVTHLPFAATV